jgi:class 3 adenylate cyclase
LYAKEGRSLNRKLGKDERIANFEAGIFVLRSVRIVLLVILLDSLLAFLAQYIDVIPSFGSAAVFEKYVSPLVKRVLPTEIAGVDLVRGIIIFPALLLYGALGRRIKNNKTEIANLKRRGEPRTRRIERDLSKGVEALTAVDRRFKKLSSSTREEREELIKTYAEMKKKIESTARHLSFLSIDVVDSTGLKEGEEKEIVELDFKKYKHFVEGILGRIGCLKSIWTPDGVMCCFETVDSAVKAAKEVITGLQYFNQRAKRIKGDFKVRCGINAGSVYFAEEVPLEEMSDQAIDIAGHMQKHAPPGSIYIARAVIEGAQERVHFTPTAQWVDKHEVWAWKKE